MRFGRYEVTVTEDFTILALFVWVVLGMPMAVVSYFIWGMDGVFASLIVFMAGILLVLVPMVAFGFYEMFKCLIDSIHIRKVK